MKTSPFFRGLRDGIPIGLGYLSVSFTFGILAAAQGIPFFYTLLISMTNLTSAGQVAGVAVIASGGTLAEIALTQLIINLRYALMSLSLSQKLDDSFNLPRRLLTAFGITDEVFAVAAGQEGDITARYMYGLIAIPYIGWASGTALGALAGNILPDLLKNALGIALYGMFIAIVVPPAKKRPKLLLVIGCAVAVSCLIEYLPFLGFISDGFAIIISTLIAASLGALVIPIDEEDPADE